MTTTVVTRATRGLGREVARRLVRAGQTVCLGARDLQRGTAVAADLGATAMQLDATDGTSVAAAAVLRLRDEVGSVDVLVNDAGVSGDQRPPGEATLADLRTVFETNVFGAAAVVDAFTLRIAGTPGSVRCSVTTLSGCVPSSTVVVPASTAARSAASDPSARACRSGRGPRTQMASVDAADPPVGAADWRELTTRNATRSLPAVAGRPGGGAG